MVRRRAGLAVLELRVGAESLDRADREARLGGQRDLCHGAQRLVAEGLIGDEGLRTGIFNDVSDLWSHQVVVDRHQVPAGLLHREQNFQELCAVRHQHRDDVALGEAGRPESVNQLVTGSQQLPCGVLGVVRFHQGYPVRVGSRDAPEAQLCHRYSS